MIDVCSSPQFQVITAAAQHHGGRFRLSSAPIPTSTTVPSATKRKPNLRINTIQNVSGRPIVAPIAPLSPKTVQPHEINVRSPLSRPDLFLDEPHSANFVAGATGPGDEFATEILPWLFLGSAKDAINFPAMNKNNIKYILNISKDDSPEGSPENRGYRYLKLNLDDSADVPIAQYFEVAHKFIDEARRDGTGALVHCRKGISRSPTIVIAYVMQHMRYGFEQAFDFVKQRRSIINPNLGFVLALESLEPFSTKKPIPASVPRISSCNTCSSSSAFAPSSVCTSKSRSAPRMSSVFKEEESDDMAIDPEDDEPAEISSPTSRADGLGALANKAGSSSFALMQHRPTPTSAALPPTTQAPTTLVGAPISRSLLHPTFQRLVAGCPRSVSAPELSNILPISKVNLVLTPIIPKAASHHQQDPSSMPQPLPLTTPQPLPIQPPQDATPSSEPSSTSSSASMEPTGASHRPAPHIGAVGPYRSLSSSADSFSPPDSEGGISSTGSGAGSSLSHSLETYSPNLVCAMNPFHPTPTPLHEDSPYYDDQLC